MKVDGRFLKLFVLVLLSAFLSMSAVSPVFAAIAGGTLDPTTVTKYVTPLVIPPAMPYTAGTSTDFYEIAVRQFQQQILPAGLPATTVWSYGSTNPAGVFHFPAFTIEATHNKPIQVKWINDLKDPVTGDCLPHLLPVDQTLHWANPAGPRDSRGMLQTPYTGPVPIITHLHGGEVNQESDGFPEAWYLPNCNLPANIKFSTGTLYDVFKTSSAVGNLWGPGSAVFTYPNAQRDATLWYHDHTLGMTRLNVYTGPAGFYIIRGDPNSQVTGTLPGPAPAVGDAGGPYYEIPIAIQDRSFNSDGSLFFPGNRAFFEGVAVNQLNIPFIPNLAMNGLPSDISPIWNPESFGNFMVVNGKSWPVLNVEPRRYRFRFLNGTLSRFLILTTDTTNTSNNAMTPALTFYQIGAEGGFLPQPVAQTHLLMGNAERADVIVDFAGKEGQTINLLNLGPDEPFGGGIPYFGCLTDPAAPAGCFEPSDPATTGQVMQFVVSAATVTDTSTPPASLILPARTPLSAPTSTRYLSLNEQMSMTPVCVAGDPVLGTYNVPIVEVACTDPTAVVFGPAEARLGTLDPVTQMPTHKEFMDALTETPPSGSTEVWEIWNFTADAHPIHIHQVQFEVIGRALQSDPTGSVGISVAGSNAPMPWETGTKDTIIVYPGEIARVKATFGSPGLTVWHCHIVDHEDNEMMRPQCVTNSDGSLPKSCVVANRVADKIAIYRGNGVWYVDVNGNGAWDGPMVDKQYNFGGGVSGAIPVRGDWNGMGSSNIGIYANGVWYLDLNGNGAYDGTPTDARFSFGGGVSGAVPVVGDWTGTGTTKVGIYANGVWYLDLNGNGAWDGTATDGKYNFGGGVAGAVPVVGDWSGNGRTKIGISANGVWYLDLSGNGAWDNTPTDARRTYTGGVAGGIPVTGDWARTGITGIGVYKDGTWYLDQNGNGVWDGALTDSSYRFGIGLVGATPLAGMWPGPIM